MKSIIIFICLLVTAAYSQNISESQVPAAVKTSFTAMYPSANGVEWELEHGKYEAEFMENKTETSVIFDSLGKHIQTETEIPVLSLPESIKSYVYSNLENKKINESTKIITASGEVMYEIGIKNTDYLFDAEGSLLKSETEKNDSDDKR
jgi:Putative beta-lactamase-inhibitor-like, PepSY-like